MSRFLLLAALAACAPGDNNVPAVDAGADPKTCDEIAAITVAAPDVGEVLLATRVFTPGISYTCDGATTWSYWARRRIDDGRLGSYGRFRIGSTECAWFDAIDARTPATGSCAGAAL